MHNKGLGFFFFFFQSAVTWQENDALNHINKNGKPLILRLNFDHKFKKCMCHMESTVYGFLFMYHPCFECLGL